MHYSGVRGRNPYILNSNFERMEQKMKKTIKRLSAITATAVLTISMAITSFAASYIGIDSAKEIALKDAGFTASDVFGLKAELDHDDRIAKFYNGNIEYDYEINATTGSVIKVERDIDDDIRVPNTTKPAGTTTPADTKAPASTTAPDAAKEKISKDKAKEIAASYIGASASDVRFTKAKLGYDDGRAEYEIDFRYGNMEYDFEIDAYTGAVLDYDTDYTFSASISNFFKALRAFFGIK